MIKPIPAVCAAIFNSEGKILITQRSTKVREPGKWCLPGGHLDGGEDWESAVVRELKEETGLIGTEPFLIGIYSDPKLTVTQDKLKEGYYAQFCVVMFGMGKVSGEVKVNEEVEEWGWYGLDDLPAPMLRSHTIRIQDGFNFNGKVFVR